MENNLLETTTYTQEDEKKYLLQIHRIKLQNYIQHGLISPDIYLGDEIEQDIQSKNKNFLVVSNGYIDKLDEYQVLLELILTKKEKEQMQKVGDISFFNFPLPITRIKKIYCQDSKIKNWIVKNLDTGEKGFIEISLFDYYKKLFKKVEYQNLESNGMVSDFSEKIRLFDKRMGMFAFMKNANKYYSNESFYVSNYSTNYFSALSYFFKDNLGNKEFSDLSVISEIEEFKNLLYSDKQMTREFMEKIADGIDDDEVKNTFDTLLQDPLSTRKALENLKEKGVYFYICLVYYFRNKNANKKDSFKSDITSLIPHKLAEVSLAILGIYLGYENIRPIEEINFKDKFFQSLFGTSTNMKFKLDSKLDYITIETIYSYIFHEEKGYEFDYITYPTKKKPISIARDKEFKIWYEVVENQEIFEAQYIKIRKKSFEEVLSCKLNKYEEELKFGKCYLLCFIKKYYEKIIYYSKNGKPVDAYCKKEDFFEAIKNDENPKVNELLDVFSLDNK